MNMQHFVREAGSLPESEYVICDCGHLSTVIVHAGYTEAQRLEAVARSFDLHWWHCGYRPTRHVRLSHMGDDASYWFADTTAKGTTSHPYAAFLQNIGGCYELDGPYFATIQECEDWIQNMLDGTSRTVERAR